MTGYSQSDFTVSASSQLENGARPIWKAFDGHYGADGYTWWTSAASLYPGGVYAGASVTYHSKGSVKGEWLQISTGVGYVLTNLTLWRPDVSCCVDRFPLKFAVLGGYDCTAWRLLKSVDGVPPPGPAQAYQVSLNKTNNSYDCYRIVIEALKNGAEGYAEIAEIAFHGEQKDVEKPVPQNTDSWFRSPSYSGSGVPSSSVIQSRVQSFERVCSRDVWAQDYSLCESLAWREVGVVWNSSYMNPDGRPCADDRTYNMGYCNWWHCWHDGCGPSGDSSFYGQSNNWLTISEYYFLSNRTHRMSFACDDSCTMYLVSGDGGSWSSIVNGADFVVSSEGMYRFVFALGNGAFDAWARITSFTPYW